MNLSVFNAAILLGWILVLVGGVLIHVGLGLMLGGVALLVLVHLAVRMGGIHSGGLTD